MAKKEKELKPVLVEEKTTEQVTDLVETHKDMMPLNDRERLTLSQYQKRNNLSIKSKTTKAFMISLIIAVGIICLAFLSQIAVNIYTFNHTAGIISGIILAICFLIIYITFIVRITKTEAFQNTYIESDRRKAHLHNRKVRYHIAENVVLLELNTPCYLKQREESDLKALTSLYHITQEHKGPYNEVELINNLDVLMKRGGLIYKTAEKTMINYSVKCGFYTAISQKNYVDASIVALMNIQMITDIIYIYGFRPSDYEVNKIIFAIIKNVCLSIGLNNVTVGSKIVGRILPQNNNNLLVELLTKLIDSSVQGVVNGSLTYLIGRRTVDYLLEEYHIQNLLNRDTTLNYAFEDEPEIEDEIKKEINKEITAHKAGNAA